MDPGFSPLAVLWEREKNQSIAFLNQLIDIDTKFA
jgi:hypothetical protein